MIFTNILLIIDYVAFFLFLAYLLAIMPRMFKRPSNKAFRGYYYAHRGFYNNETQAPENSMKAFELAVKKGYGIELDVQLSKDRVPVVFHDDSLFRSCKVKGEVKDYMYQELMQFSLFDSKEKIPRFEQVLSLVNGKVPLIVEIKCDDSKVNICQIVYDLLKEYQGVYCVESFNPFVVHWFKKHAKGILRGQLSSNYAMIGNTHFLQKCVGYLLFNFWGKPDFIAYDCYYVNTISRSICRNLYRSLSVAWTITSQKQLDGLKDKYDLFIFEDFEPM